MNVKICLSVPPLSWSDPSHSSWSKSNMSYAREAAKRDVVAAQISRSASLGCRYNFGTLQLTEKMAGKALALIPFSCIHI